ncbi:MAG: hypothetical protein F9B45_18130 [Phycisphaera sp. RhM]|nr:hypothetical protein [Phycisphaera sp. RhM]
MPLYDDCINGWEAVQEHGRSVGDQDLVDLAGSEIEDLRTELSKDEPRTLTVEDFHPATIPREVHDADGFAGYLGYGPTTVDHAMAMDFVSRKQVAAARARLDTGRSTPEIWRNRQSLKLNIDNFLLQKRLQVESGDLSATRAEMLLRHFELVLEHFDERMDVTEIGGKALVEFRQFCLSKLSSGRLSESMARDALAAFKQLIKWMYSTAEIIDRLPRNFDDKALAIHVSPSEPETLSVDQISALLDLASVRTEL